MEPTPLATSASDPAAWPAKQIAGPYQRTPSVSSAVQQAMGQGGWPPSNATMVIITGWGKRTAESFNGSVAGAPTLGIEYTLL